MAEQVQITLFSFDELPDESKSKLIVSLCALQAQKSRRESRSPSGISPRVKARKRARSSRLTLPPGCSYAPVRDTRGDIGPQSWRVPRGRARSVPWLPGTLVKAPSSARFVALVLACVCPRGHSRLGGLERELR